MREEAPGLGDLASDFNFNQPPRAPLILPTHPAPGPASSPPGSPAPANPPACVPPPSTPPPPTTPPSAVPMALNLTASVAPRQDVRRHHSVYATVGCNMSCSLYAHGHLNLTDRHHHDLRLGSVKVQLAADHSLRIALTLSRRTLHAVRAALRDDRKVQATIAVEVSAPGQPRRGYLARVRFTYR